MIEQSILDSLSLCSYAVAICFWLQNELSFIYLQVKTVVFILFWQL